MLRIRPATIHDAALLYVMIRELAEFERELDLVTIQEADLKRDGFGEHSRFRAFIAEFDEQPAGYALFWPYYSTWEGPSLFLEDLFVRESFRGARNRDGLAGRGSADCGCRTLLRNTLGGARLERKGD